jgi:hypothetical protein
MATPMRRFTERGGRVGLRRASVAGSRRKTATTGYELEREGALKVWCERQFEKPAKTASSCPFSLSIESAEQRMVRKMVSRDFGRRSVGGALIAVDDCPAARGGSNKTDACGGCAI